MPTKWSVNSYSGKIRECQTFNYHAILSSNCAQKPQLSGMLRWSIHVVWMRNSPVPRLDPSDPLAPSGWHRLEEVRHWAPGSTSSSPLWSVPVVGGVISQFPPLAARPAASTMRPCHDGSLPSRTIYENELPSVKLLQISVKSNTGIMALDPSLTTLGPHKRTDDTKLLADLHKHTMAHVSNKINNLHK